MLKLATYLHTHRAYGVNVNNVSNVSKTTSLDGTISHEHEVQTNEREHHANNIVSSVHQSITLTYSERETLSTKHCPQDDVYPVKLHTELESSSVEQRHTQRDSSPVIRHTQRIHPHSYAVPSVIHPHSYAITSVIRLL